MTFREDTKLGRVASTSWTEVDQRIKKQKPDSASENACREKEGKLCNHKRREVRSGVVESSGHHIWGRDPCDVHRCWRHHAKALRSSAMAFWITSVGLRSLCPGLWGCWALISMTKTGCHELVGTCQPTWLFPLPLGDGSPLVKHVWELQSGFPLVTMRRNGNFEGVTQIILKQEPKLGQTNHASEVF